MDRRGESEGSKSAKKSYSTMVSSCSAAALSNPCAVWGDMLAPVGLWYRGIARVDQLQLLQPFFGLLLAWLVLGEPVEWTMVASTILVILCVAGARRFS